MMKNFFHSILAPTALCLTAAACVSCAPEHEYVSKQVGGAEIPAGWDFSTKKQWTVSHDFPDGGHLNKQVIDFSGLPEFTSYCGKEVKFHLPLAIQRVDYAAGTFYELKDYKPQPDGVIDLYHVPVQKGKLLAVRCLWEELTEPRAKVFKLESLSVEALLEVQHPDVQVNNGKPLYLTYILADDKTPPHHIRAPWKAPTATESPHALELLREAIKNTTAPESVSTHQ